MLEMLMAEGELTYERFDHQLQFGMHECERIIQTIEHFYGHLHIECSGHLGLLRSNTRRTVIREN